ncbi:MAG: hypothetical protein RL172_901 [Bacteroidota bacterium]|jgi:enediyne biosynthesis protein E5
MLLQTSRGDARNFQISFQLLFIFYGVLQLHWYTAWLHYLLFIVATLLFQWLASCVAAMQFSLAGIIKNGAWKSALISSLGLCLLLKVNYWPYCLLAAGIMVASKFLLQFKHRHLFNPSAFAIAVMVLLTGKAWISPAQWGSNAVLFFAVICLGVIVATKVQQLDVTIAFIVTYAGLTFVRQVLYLGWPIDFFVQTVSTGSLLLFSFFMITDPKTTPNHPGARLLWASIIGGAAFYLATFLFIQGAPIWALVCSQPLVPVLNHFFKHHPFTWHNTNSKPVLINL